MGLTAIEKVLARTSGKDVVRPGDIAVCRPDLVVQADLFFSVTGSWHRPKKIFDPERVVQLFDHAVPAPTIRDASGMAEARRFAKQFKPKYTFDVGAHGISHVVVAENRLARPGELLVCSDSHTCASNHPSLGPLATHSCRMIGPSRSCTAAPSKVGPRFAGNSTLFQFADKDVYVSRADTQVVMGAVSAPKERRFYEADHGMAVPQAAADRDAWLLKELGLGGPGLPPLPSPSPR